MDERVGSDPDAVSTLTIGWVETNLTFFRTESGPHEFHTDAAGCNQHLGKPGQFWDPGGYNSIGRARLTLQANGAILAAASGVEILPLFRVRTQVFSGNFTLHELQGCGERMPVCTMMINKSRRFELSRTR